VACLLESIVNVQSHRRNLNNRKLHWLMLHGGDRALVLLSPCGGLISAADFDRSEWEIVYPLFVAEGLVDPSDHVDR
jgi:hypothetical protein